MKTLSLFLISAALAGCASTPTQPLPDMRPLPVQAMTPGPIPAPITDKTFAGTVNKLVEVSGLLSMCVSDKAELADWITRGR